MPSLAMLLGVPSAPTTGWRGRIFLDAGWILYVGPGSSAERHAHHATQFVWSRDGAFEIHVDGAPRHREAVLVPANVAHTLHAVDRTIALLLVDPNGGRGVALERIAAAGIGTELCAKLSAIGFPNQITASETAAWCSTVLHALGATTAATELSSVSRRAIAYVESTLEGVPRLSDAAARVRLSPTRLTHVFSEEVGIPFRRFVLWTRIKRAVLAFQAGHDLSTSAIAAGFSDAAHFSRTFRAMFGLSPSLVLPLAEIVGPAWQ